VYRELFFATWGGWDEARHLRHCAECWERGEISCIEIDGVRVGMIQLFDQPNVIEIGEIQIQPSYQNRGIGTRLLRDTISLSVALKNERAYRLYERLGFQKVARNDTRNIMVHAPQS
jgi:ribosomal protein S18 acetylase RimI-like enzyme